VRLFGLFPILLVLQVQSLGAQSLDIGPRGYGLSIGNSKRFTGLRINAVDRGVEQINGLNITLWNPGENPDADYRGIALALIGTKSRKISGIALSGIGLNARERVRGISAGVLGVGGGNMTGIAAGLIMVDVKQRMRGMVLAGLWTGRCETLDGFAVSPGGAIARHIRGATIGGVFAGGPELSGLGLSAGFVLGARQRGVGVGGLATAGKDLKGFFASGLVVGATELRGIACSPGIIGGATLKGIMLSGLGLGASDRIRGVAVGSILVFAPEVNGLAVGALNGVYIDRIDLEDFLHFNRVNRSFTGLSVGLVNYTAKLKGVQLGLFNYAGNNTRALRLLPLINVHI
jgi:hypothetical protein